MTGKPDLIQITKQIKTDIETASVRLFDDGHRKHLGASEIGHPCSRYLWYKFRWFFKEKFSGRMLRLFNRGHREEAAVRRLLEAIGAQFLDAPDQQRRMVAVSGHFGGSRDGALLLPAYGLNSPVLLEVKTKGTGKGFQDLQSDGLKYAETKHWAQCCTYGVGFDLQYALYWSSCKNDDDTHIELTELDHDHGNKMLAKAQFVIVSPEPPPKISRDPSWYICRYCAAAPVCHHGAQPLNNCRSCKHSRPAENAQWHCGKFNSEIPSDWVEKEKECWER